MACHRTNRDTSKAGRCGLSRIACRLLMCSFSLLGESVFAPAQVPLQAADPSANRELANRELHGQVMQLLRGLDANQRTRRQQSERDLLDLGPSILPLLPPPELLPNQNVRTTVLRIRVTLERRQALESVQTSRVTLPTGESLHHWISKIEAQTGNEFDHSGVPRELLDRTIPDRPQTTTIENQPFWPALEQTLHTQNLGFAFDPDAGLIKLVPQSDPTCDRPWQTAYDGPFRLGVNWIKPRPVAGNLSQQRLRAELSIAPEPRLRALFLKLAARDFLAETNSGVTLAAADAAAQYDLPLGEGGHFVRWNLDFAAPATLTPTEIFPLTIRGKASMQIAAGTEHIRFTDLVDGAGTARRRGGVTVTLQKVLPHNTSPQKRGIAVKVLVVYDTGGPAFESHRTWIFHNQVYLTRDGKTEIGPNGGFDTDLQSNGAVGVTYRFEGLIGDLQDYQFVYVAPTLMTDVPIEIVFPTVEPFSTTESPSVTIPQ